MKEVEVKFEGTVEPFVVAIDMKKLKFEDEVGYTLAKVD